MSAQSETYWDKINPRTQDQLVWGIWFLTWMFLLAGLYDRGYYAYVVGISAAHAVLFLVLFKFRVADFPVQLRIAYFTWVAVGTYVPYMVILMYITTIGLAANLFFGYCPLARIMYLMPWNRDEPFTGKLIMRTILAPPVKGAFKPTAPGPARGS
jgi:hypothetical protein